MPHVCGTYPESIWRPRYERINEFESQLVADGCTIIKIFLVSSKEEQRKHFLGRLEDPTKYWKFDISDLDARERWDDYMAACRRCSNVRAPKLRLGIWCPPITVGIPVRWSVNYYVMRCDAWTNIGPN